MVHHKRAPVTITCGYVSAPCCRDTANPHRLAQHTRMSPTSPCTSPCSQHLRCGNIAAQRIITAPSRPWEMNDSSRRRRVRSHLIQAALWAPTIGETDACLGALVEQQESDDNCANHWAETSECRHTEQTRQSTQTPPMPIRANAAPCSLRQTPPPSKITTAA